MAERRNSATRPTFTQAFFRLKAERRREIAAGLGLCDDAREARLSELERGKSWLVRAQHTGKLADLQQAIWVAWRTLHRHGVERRPEATP